MVKLHSLSLSLPPSFPLSLSLSLSLPPSLPPLSLSPSPPPLSLSRAGHLEEAITYFKSDDMRVIDITMVSNFAESLAKVGNVSNTTVLQIGH